MKIKPSTMLGCALLALIPQAQAEPAKGIYACYYLAGTMLNYSLVDVHILSDSQYRDRQGKKGSYTTEGEKIIFKDGPFAKQKSYFRNGNVYLTSEGGSFYMNCSPKKK